MFEVKLHLTDAVAITRGYFRNLKDAYKLCDAWGGKYTMTVYDMDNRVAIYGDSPTIRALLSDKLTAPPFLPFGWYQMTQDQYLRWERRLIENELNLTMYPYDAWPSFKSRYRESGQTVLDCLKDYVKPPATRRMKFMGGLLTI